jgi:hypothetical protein
MRFSSLIAQGLLATGVTAARSKKFRRDIEPEGPTDPGITPKCTYYDTWFNNNNIDCLLWLSDWNITPQQFSEYVSIYFIYQISLWFLGLIVLFLL